MAENGFDWSTRYFSRLTSVTIYSADTGGAVLSHVGNFLAVAVSLVSSETTLAETVTPRINTIGLFPAGMECRREIFGGKRFFVLWRQ